MAPENSPAIGIRYWLAILLASVCGTNTGDLYAHDSGLGIVGGLLLLAVLSGLTFAAERRSSKSTVLWYWVVIIVIRTGATNIADFLAWRVHVPIPLLLGVLGLLIGLLGRLGRTVGRDGQASPVCDGPFWLAMLAAGVFGTAAGDAAQHGLGQGVAALLLGALFAGALVLTRARFTSLAGYWLIVCLARTAGTAIGDWLAESEMLRLGLPAATALSASAFLISVVFSANHHSAGKPKNS